MSMDYEPYIERTRFPKIGGSEQFIQRLLTGAIPVAWEWDAGRVKFSLSPQAVRYPALPKGYGFKGGVARQALLSGLLEPAGSPSAVRDLDIVRFGIAPHPEDDRLAKEHSPDDFSRGFGVEVVSDFETYARSRDVTINQAALFGATLRATPLAVLDALARIIRPATVLRGTLHQDPALGSAILARMARLRAELGTDWQYRDQREVRVVSSFDVALNLRKALTKGEDCARRFLIECEELGLLERLTVDAHDPLPLVQELLSKELPGGISFFDP